MSTDSDNQPKPKKMVEYYIYCGDQFVASGWKESNYPEGKTKAILNELFLYIQSGKPIRKNNKAKNTKRKPP